MWCKRNTGVSLTLLFSLQAGVDNIVPDSLGGETSRQCYRGFELREALSNLTINQRLPT